MVCGFNSFHFKQKINLAPVLRKLKINNDFIWRSPVFCLLNTQTPSLYFFENNGEGGRGLCFLLLVYLLILGKVKLRLYLPAGG